MKDSPSSVLSNPATNLLWIATALAWLTWSPFDFGASRALIRFGIRGITPETVANLLLLVPLSINIAETMRRSTGVARALLWTVVATMAAAATIELVQLFITARVTSVADWALNSAGGAAAGGFWLIWQAPWPRRSRWLAAASGSMLAPVLLLHAYTLTKLPSAFDPSDWSDVAVVAIGEEVGGLRPLIGAVSDASICTEGAFGQACLGATASRDEAAAFNRLVDDNRHVRLEARVVSESDEQRGPARILSYAVGPGQRNATIGVDRRALLFRMRTSFTGPNGVYPEFVLLDAMPRSTSVHVVAEYDDGEVALSSDGGNGPKGWRLRPSVLGGAWVWTRIRQLRGPTGWLLVAFTAGALFMPFGLVAGAWPGMSRAGRWWAWAAVAAAVPVASLATGLSPRPTEVLASLLAYGLGVRAASVRRDEEDPPGGLWPAEGSL
ncbi:MAG: VanZ family protein [Gemmatimonadota bacterium]|nr:VanZ family protein [Gemmatimonadota bacterium]